MDATQRPMAPMPTMPNVHPARHISGAVLDAFSQEPPSSMPFAALPNVLLSPHVGAFTEEALEKMSRIAVDQVFQFLDGERPMHMNVR